MDLWTLLEWVGKIFFVTMFLIYGVSHLANHKALTAYAQSKKVPAAPVAVAVTGLMMLTASAMILFSWHPTWGAWLLVIYLVPTALIMHNYWAETDPMMKANQMAHFWKNITIAAAALLMAVGHGRGM
ncbi:MAG TPA: DoxX family membrane protein [Gemmatimonadales bacterium]